MLVGTLLTMGVAMLTWWGTVPQGPPLKILGSQNIYVYNNQHCSASWWFQTSDCLIYIPVCSMCICCVFIYVCVYWFLCVHLDV